MSLFKERQASAKKVIQLQNEVLELKMRISQMAKPKECEECEDCTQSLKEIQSILDNRNQQVSLLQEEVASLKADLKKTRSENTRLKNKFSALQAAQEKSEEDV